VPSKDILEIGNQAIAPGERVNIKFAVSQDYHGRPITIPLQVRRGVKPGPTVFVTGALHGDELNGTGIVREMIIGDDIEIIAGSLVLVPVVNILGFERHSRYLPDRRDLNRSFPGSATGSLAARYADALFKGIVAQCDFGIDLHTAAVRRTNFPNIRADLKHPETARLAAAFGTELLVNGKGPEGSLRRCACAAGKPTIILEAGEVWKIEPSVVEIGVRGVRNVLVFLGMVEGEPVAPVYQANVYKTQWVRAETGGLLHFHVAPGDVVQSGQPLATNTNLLGEAKTTLTSPADGVVLGMTTLPAVSPGAPVCHLALPEHGIDSIRETIDRLSPRSLAGRLRDDLATNLTVSDSQDVHGG
jgi:predicted deacylase